MKRRTVLRSISVGVIGAITGCLHRREGIRIPEVQVGNSTHKKQMLKIKISYDDDIVYDKKYTIPGQDGSVVHGPVIEDLPDTPGEWVIEATAMGLKKRNHVEINVNESTESDCAIPVISIRKLPSWRLTVTTLEDCDFATYSD